MKVGSIFLWEKFIQQADYRIKDRWFIYLGCSPSFYTPVFAYIATTTGQTHYYKDNSKYSKNNIVWFKQGECNFNKECVLDLDRNFFDDIELKNIVITKVIDVIPETKMKIIYEKICNNPNIKLKIRENIHFCFNRDGIIGLKKPKN